MLHIVTVNSTTAKLFINYGSEDSVHQADERNYEFKNPSELQRDSQGVTQSDAPSIHMLESFEPRTTESDKQRDDIAQQIVEALVQNEAKINQMILAASPELLGFVRAHMPDALQKRIIKEIPKDLTHCTERELPSHLSDVVDLFDPKHDFNKELAQRTTTT